MINAENLRGIFKVNLNTLIKKKGITQRDLASFMHVNPSTVNEWVKGKKIPRMDKIDRLCDYFLIKRSDLLESNPTSENNTVVHLDDVSLKLVTDFKALSPTGKNMLLGLLSSLRVTHSIIPATT